MVNEYFKKRPPPSPESLSTVRHLLDVPVGGLWQVDDRRMATQDDADDRAGITAVGGRRGEIQEAAAQWPDYVQRPYWRTHGIDLASIIIITIIIVVVFVIVVVVIFVIVIVVLVVMGVVLFIICRRRCLSLSSL